MELIVITLLTLIVFPVIAFAEGVLRNISGVGFLVFFPGYAIVSALFPNKYTIKILERVVLSIIASISVVILTGLALNFTPWGIRLMSIYTAVSIIIVVVSGIALFRRKHIPHYDRFSISSKLKRPDWSQASRTSFVLSLFFILIIVAAISTTAYIIPQPKSHESFTNFYILGPEGKMDDYPRELVVGEPTELTLCIENHQNQDALYDVIMVIDGEEKQLLNSLLLSDGQTLSHNFTLEVSRPVENKKVEFRLYKGGNPEPYLSLHFWLDANK